MRYIVKRDDKLRFCINATNGQIEPEYYWYIFDDVEKIKITGPRKLEKIVGRCERLNYEESSYLNHVAEYCS
jgi:hypothetical protein